MKRDPLPLSLLALLAITGCSQQHPTQPAPTTAPAATTDVSPQQQIDDSLPYQHTFTTTLSPGDAAQKITALFHQLRFKITTSALFQDAAPPPPESEDFFSAHEHAETADGHHLLVTCEWLANGKTAVTFHSNLNNAQNAYLVRRIQAILNDSAATP